MTLEQKLQSLSPVPASEVSAEPVALPVTEEEAAPAESAAAEGEG